MQKLIYVIQAASTSNAKQLNVDQLSKAIISHATENKYNIVLHKKNRKEVAVMSKPDFYELLNMLLRNRIINKDE